MLSNLTIAVQITFLKYIFNSFTLNIQELLIPVECMKYLTNQIKTYFISTSIFTIASIKITQFRNLKYQIHYVLLSSRHKQCSQIWKYVLLIYYTLLLIRNRLQFISQNFRMRLQRWQEVSMVSASIRHLTVLVFQTYDIENLRL